MDIFLYQVWDYIYWNISVSERPWDSKGNQYFLPFPRNDFCYCAIASMQQ
jgi:hypothetical protein